MSAPVRVSLEREGQLARLVLDRPKANILDLEMMTALRKELGALGGQKELKLLVFEGAGDHFCFGASVKEHLPAQAGEMLRGFHALFRELEALSVPTAAVVRGQCLGGGFELALFAGQVFCSPSARFGVPEVKLAVFPPIAALLLPWRTGGARATTLVLTGASIEGPKAVELGLAEACGEDPEALLGAWFEAHLAECSALALRYAWRAARRPIARALEEALPALEKLYLEELMAHHDPVEGITAFVERRKPVWRNQ
ncbi:MAG: enoyl-CoA hydratase/isomerase family protein [Deltaproteobacteria bacterium]|nr:enoyl-CoA hydratase/isomerase family protein [Deltaproteobacteria bacterium]